MYGEITPGSSIIDDETTEKMEKGIKDLLTLVVPKTNSVDFNCLGKGPQMVDSALQCVTLLIMKGMIPTIQLMDLIGKGSEDSIQNHLEQMSDSVWLLTVVVNYVSEA